MHQVAPAAGSVPGARRFDPVRMRFEHLDKLGSQIILAMLDYPDGYGFPGQRAGNKNRPAFVAAQADAAGGHFFNFYRDHYKIPFLLFPAFIISADHGDYAALISAYRPKRLKLRLLSGAGL